MQCFKIFSPALQCFSIFFPYEGNFPSLLFRKIPVETVQFLGICCTMAMDTAMVKAVKKQSLPKCMEICALPIKR